IYVVITVIRKEVVPLSLLEKAKHNICYNLSIFCAGLRYDFRTGVRRMKRILAITIAIMIYIILISTAFAYNILEKGSKGDEVKALQEALINQRYLSGFADGDFGKKTESAVIAFQADNGIQATGIADNKTQELLFEQENIRLEKVILSKGSKGSDVVKLQERLIELGYYSGKAKGVYDDMTEAAVIVFQAHNAISPSGLADKETRDILYSRDALSIDDEPVNAETNASINADGSDKESAPNGETDNAIKTEKTKNTIKMTLREGEYIVGEDFDAGDYTITCIITEGNKDSAFMNAFGDMMNADEETAGFGSMFSVYGMMFDDGNSDMTVEIIDGNGSILKSWKMAVDDSMAISLEEGYTVKIVKGNCTITSIE
ncbi:MAG: peptidoglycan-binding protein, partial [Clostridia bacterium]|nr:peptidoglycan-binding protein [Clostridia bacterium]